MRTNLHAFGLAALVAFGAPVSSATASQGADMFANAPLITGSYSLETLTPTQNFTKEAGEPASDLDSGKTAWWKWTAPANGYCTIDAIRTSQVIQTEVAVYTGNTVNALTPVTANASNLGLPQARAAFYATAGKTYRIRVDSSALLATLPDVLLQLRFLEPRKRLLVGAWNSPVENTVPGANGLLTMSVTQGGVATGVLTKGTTRYPFKTVLSSDGFANVSFLQKPSINNPLGVPLNLEVDVLAANSANFAMSVNDGIAIQGTGDLDELGAFTATNPTPSAGNYNVALQFANVSGIGFAIVKIGPTGLLRMSGLAGDGKAIAFGGAMANDGRVHVHQGFQNGTGFFHGVFSAAGGSFSTSRASYRRPPTPNSTFYPVGFVAEFTAAGVRYSKPAAGTRAMGFLDAMNGAGKLKTVNAPGELMAITENLTFTKLNQFVFASATRKPVLKLNPATGLVTGTINEPSATPRIIRGILSQENGTVAVRGFVGGKTCTAGFTVLP